MVEVVDATADVVEEAVEAAAVVELVAWSVAEAFERLGVVKAGGSLVETAHEMPCARDDVSLVEMLRGRGDLVERVTW